MGIIGAIFAHIVVFAVAGGATLAWMTSMGVGVAVAVVVGMIVGLVVTLCAHLFIGTDFSNINF